MKRKYGYRKFKGIGLASAVIGFTLLSTPVYAESSDGGGGGKGLVNAAEAASTNPQPEGNVIALGEDGVPWELYENGYLLFKPVAGKDTLISNRGETSWKVNHGSKIKHVGFAGKVYAPADSSYLFSTASYRSNYKNHNFNPTMFDTANLDTSKVTNMRYMFYSISSLTNLDVTHFDTRNVTDMSSMFQGMSNLTTLDVTHFDTSKVTNMRSMFHRMSNLTNLDVTHFDTSKVTNMNSMFDRMSKLTNLDVTHFDTSKVTNMDYMFSGMSKLTSLDVTKFDTSKVTDMRQMFSSTSKLTNLDVTKFDTSKVTDMGYMFNSMASLTNLDVTNFDTSKVTDMRDMFENMFKLKELKLGDTFKADGIRTIPTSHNYGDQYTDKWHKVNDKDHPYTVSDWAVTYASNPTANAGTWVREEKVQDATLKFQGETFIPVKVKPSDITLPTLPRPSQPKANHKFLGWSKDGRNPLTRDEVKPGETITLQPLWQPVDNTTTRTEEIPVTTTYSGDDNLDVGKQAETPGTPGEKRITTTYTVTPYTGELTNPVETTEIIRNMTPKVITIGTKPTSMVENIPSPKVYQADPSRPRGSEDIVTQGQPGSKTTTTTYTVNPDTGQVTPTQHQPVVKQPTNTIVKVATQDKVAKSNPVERTTRVNKDNTKPIGYRHVETEGSDGYTETITHYDVDATNGNVTERTETRTVPPVERVVTEGALAYDLPTTGTADMTITLAGLAGTLVITKRKKTSK